MGMTSKEYKEMSVKEFTKAARVYDSGHAGIYEMCKYDYSKILSALKDRKFTDLLDCGCGTGPMIEILCEKYPDKHYTGLDLTPGMIEKAKEKKLHNAEFVVGDCENLPFPDGSFDVVICTNSFHHYPDPQAFFDSVHRVLRKNGCLILRDYTSSDSIVWLMNHIEMPLAHLCGHGDVKIHSCSEVRELCAAAGLKVRKLEPQKGFRLHLVAEKRKPR